MVIIDSLSTKCDKCELYEHLWVEEKERREFYEKVYLTKTGAFSDPEVSVTSEDFKPVRRYVTPSDLKRQATMLRRKQSEPERLASESEKTEAERLFEESLGEVKQ